MLKLKNNLGFTMIELMVSASIIAMMSVLVVANFRGSTQKTSLNNETERLSTILREANINSLVGLTVNGTRPEGGFGLHVEDCSFNCQYIIFADQDEDYIYDSNNDGSPVSTIGMLDDNVYIKTLILEDSILVPGTPVDIVFVPPQGDIMINGGINYDSAAIVLGFINSDYEKRIIINRVSGRLNIQ